MGEAVVMRYLLCRCFAAFVRCAVSEPSGGGLVGADGAGLPFCLLPILWRIGRFLKFLGVHE